MYRQHPGAEATSSASQYITDPSSKQVVESLTGHRLSTAMHTSRFSTCCDTFSDMFKSKRNDQEAGTILLHHYWNCKYCLAL
jgi:hypothetical protein